MTQNSETSTSNPERSVDLTITEKPTYSNDPVSLSSPYSPDKDREKVRGRIAQILVWSLVVLLGMTMLLTLLDVEKAIRAKEVVSILIAPLVGIVGTAVGFYYGQGK